MLLLLFQLGGDRYALDASKITEVLPLVAVRPIPQAPAGVAGVFDYRGEPVPAIDVSMLVLGRPAEHQLSTRVLVVGYPDATGATRRLGLIAEKATETVRRDRTDFVDSGVSNERAPYLGPIMHDAAGLVQWIDVGTLLPTSVRDVLFTGRGDERWPLPTSKAC